MAEKQTRKWCNFCKDPYVHTIPILVWESSGHCRFFNFYGLVRIGYTDKLIFPIRLGLPHFYCVLYPTSQEARTAKPLQGLTTGSYKPSSDNYVNKKDSREKEMHLSAQLGYKEQQIVVSCLVNCDLWLWEVSCIQTKDSTKWPWSKCLYTKQDIFSTAFMQFRHR